MISLSFLCFCITGSCYGCCEHYIKRGRDWHCAQAQSSFGQHILFYYFIDNCILCSQALNILTAASPYLFPNFLFLVCFQISFCLVCFQISFFLVCFQISFFLVCFQISFFLVCFQISFFLVRFQISFFLVRFQISFFCLLF